MSSPDPTAEQLTPRSKVKALIAHLDDSDSDIPVSKALFEKKSAQRSGSDDRESNASPKVRRAVVDNDSSDDEMEDFSDILDKGRLGALAEEKRKIRELQELQEQAESERDEANAKGNENESDSREDGEGQPKKRSSNSSRQSSKKAQQLIQMETQRLARNMQLTHEAKTRKKIAKESLFERFNFKPTAANSTQNPFLGHSAVESTDNAPKDSNFTPDNEVDSSELDKEDPGAPKGDRIELDEVEKPPIELENNSGTKDDTAELKSNKKSYQKGKGKVEPTALSRETLQKRVARLQVNRSSPISLDSSDSELEIEGSKLKKPTANTSKGSSARRNQLGIDQFRNDKRLKMQHQLESLKNKSKEQAAAYREDRLAQLRAKGIAVQSAEDRFREIEEVEDLLEKARREAKEIQKREQQEEKLANGEDLKENATVNGEWLESDDALDEDYKSGSDNSDDEVIKSDEDGEENEAEAEGSDEDREPLNPKSPSSYSLSSMWNRNSSPTPRLSGMPEPFPDSDSQDLAQDSFLEKIKKRAPRRIVDDEEDETEEGPVPFPSSAASMLALNDVAPLGLSQMFNGTIGAMGSPTQTARVADSAEMDVDGPPIVELSYSQTQRDFDSTLPEALRDEDYPMEDIAEDFPDPTPDTGFIRSSSPAPPQFGYDSSDEESPSIKRKGRLVRGADLTKRPSMREKVLKKKAILSVEEEKHAKELLQEQAEESDDEYAGIGGASDEERDEDEAGDLEGLVDDTEQHVDEREMAAYYAAKEKELDNQRVNKLFKDITNGMLRKRRVNDFDLSDSEDEAEARQRAKRRARAKLRKALLEDANLGKIASDPKKLAFLTAIEDMEKETEGSFLDAPMEEDPLDFTSTPNEEAVPEDQLSARQIEKAPARLEKENQKRHRKSRAVNVQEQLSFLTEAGDIGDGSSSDSDLEIERPGGLQGSAVVDRSEILRTAAAKINAAGKFSKDIRTPGSLYRKGAPKVPGAGSTGPAATVSVNANIERSSTAGNGAIKKAAKASSSINFQAREQRRAVQLGDTKSKQKLKGVARSGKLDAVFTDDGFA